MEPEFSLLRSQATDRPTDTQTDRQTDTCPYPEPEESNTLPPSLF
jgi:hypothetical protein